MSNISDAGEARIQNISGFYLIFEYHIIVA